MKLLMISTHDRHCGLSTYNQALAAALTALGDEVGFLPLNTTGPGFETEADYERAISALFPRLSDCDGLILQHEYGNYGGRLSLLFAQKAFGRLLRRIAATGKPVAIFYHSDPVATTRLLSRKRFVWSRIRALVNAHPRIRLFVHGDLSRERYLEAGIAKGRIDAIHHPFPPVMSPPPREPGGDFVLGIFGFISEYKGYAAALEALRMLPERFRLVVAGERHPDINPLDTAFRDVTAAAESDLKGRVTVTGWLAEDEIARVMAGCDAILAAYREDGPAGSGAITWAMCSGRPAIVSDTRTFRHLQEGAQCFAMVPPNDAGAIAEAALALEANPDLRDELARRAADFARRNDWRQLAARLRAHFQAHGAPR